jgi:hypothetical protein
MRFRSVVLPAAVALTAVAAVPSSALAASQCALVMPTKVVVNQQTERMDFNLTASCQTNSADHAYWDLTHSNGTGGPLHFESADIEQRYFYIEWYDTDAMGNWHLTPEGAAQADGDPLTQNSATIKVKYGSRFVSKVTRSSTGALSWAVTAQQWSGRAHTWVGRSKVNVGLFHLPTGSTTWKYVKSVTATSTGRATVTLGAPKSGSYRLMVGETPTAWASYTTPVKGRI